MKTTLIKKNNWFLSVVVSLAVWLVMLVVISDVHAAVITLKNGDTVGGIIVEKTEHYIKIDTGIGVPITYYADEVDDMWTEPVNIDRPEDEPLITEVIEPVVMPTVVEPFEQEANQDQAAKASFMQKALVVFGLVMFFHITIGFLHFLTSCYPLYVMGKESEEVMLWTAWVPIAQLFLLCRISEKPTWLMVLLVVPLVGLLVRIYLYGSLCHVRDKSFLMAIITAIPVIGFALPWYLAHSE